jgi:type VI secretion system protein ImpH
MAVLRALETEPTSFGAFQAVRLLGRLRPERAPVGGWADPASEVVRFTAPPSLAFPAAEVRALRPSTEGEGPHRLSVNFFGLTGPQAVLPHVYTQHAAERARGRDTAFRDFLDLFHHRALSLFYRTWARAKPVIGHEAGRDDWLLDHLLDVAGLGTAGLRGRLPVADEALGHYAGLLAPAARPADGLARLVGDYFGVPATVEQFVGEWRRIATGGQTTLGTDDAHSRLGFGVVGDEAWDPQARVRLRLGPLTRAQFDAFLPGGDAHPSLVALVRLYADDQVGVDAQLVLDRGAVAPCVLGLPLGQPLGQPLGAPGGATGAAGPPLGRGTWLVSRPLARDPDETALALC